MDASVHFHTDNISHVIESAKTLTVMAAKGGGSITKNTVKKMFEILDEEPCTFRNIPEIQAGFIIYYGSSFGVNYFMRPWISCALTLECMVPNTNPLPLVDCTKEIPTYHRCHRFEQSMMGILLNRLFHLDLSRHVLKDEIFTFNRGQSC